MRRNRPLYILMTEKELNFVKQMAKNCNLNTSEFVRMTLRLKGLEVVRELNGSRRKIPPIEVILEKEYAQEIRPQLERYFPDKWVKHWYGED